MIVSSIIGNAAFLILGNKDVLTLLAVIGIVASMLLSVVHAWVYVRDKLRRERGIY